MFKVSSRSYPFNLSQQRSTESDCALRIFIRLLSIRPRFVFYLVFFTGFAIANPAVAEVFLVRDYGSGVTLSAGQSELSLDYLGMNETLDLLGIRDSWLETVSAVVAGEQLGDLSGGRLLASYGVADNLMLSGSCQYRDINVTFTGFEVDNCELALTARHNFYRRPNERAAYLFGRFGVRHNRAGIFYPVI